jgi:hypothetical protein
MVILYMSVLWNACVRVEVCLFVRLPLNVIAECLPKFDETNEHYRDMRSILDTVMPSTCVLEIRL